MKKLIAIILCFICYGGSVCYAQDIVKELKEENDGFKWYLLTQNNYTYWGAEDINGNTIIPLEDKYNLVGYDERIGLFYCIFKGKNNKELTEGIFDTKGKTIIAPWIYDNIVFHNVPSFFYVYKKGKEGICDMKGKEIIPPKYKNLIYSDNTFKYKKGKWVALNISLPEDPLQQYEDGLRYEEMELYKEALECYERAHVNGNIAATYKCGYFYFMGRPYYLYKDYGKAFSFFSKAAEQGDMNSQSYMGYCFENGKGTLQNMERAKEWYEKAANQGNTYAKERLLAINPTDANAQNDLGVKFYNENKDYSEAIMWFKKAAAQGHKYAEYNMGLCYEYGNGTTKNKQEALAWYKKAKNHGHPDAAKRIAELTRPVTPPQTYTAQTQTTKPQTQTSQVQKFHDALAFELLDDGMKECKLKHEYYGGPAVIVDLSFLNNYSEIYKFSRDGQLTNAAEIGITNIQRNKKGYIISYKKNDYTYKLEYESLPTKAGINSIRLKRLSWESPEPCEYRYVELDDAEILSGIWEERHFYKNGKLEKKEKIEQRWDENYSKNHKKYFYFFPASEKKATEKNIKECVTREPIYWK